MHICFILEEWTSIDPETNSSLRIIHEAAARGHVVGILNSRNLTVRSNVVYGFFKMISKESPISKNIKAFFKNVVFEKCMLPLKGFDVIFLRKDPPLEPITLNFLDSVKDETFIINDIDGIRKANNKLYLTTFQDFAEYLPETHVSKNKDYLLSVIKESKFDKMILKPLAGFGGRGVIVLEKSAMQNISSLLDFYIGSDANKNHVILQEYVSGADQGDVRVMMLNGEPIGAMRRVPAPGEFRSNVHVGGTPVKHVLSKQELELCRKIGPKLVADGIYFAGMDLIGGKLIEVNVLSPGGIRNINRLNKVHLQRLVLDFIEEKHRKNERSASQKQEFRKMVENA